jgi:ATP adenylyltransferase
MDKRPLWAPWRIEYVTGAKDEECVFCTAAHQVDDAEWFIVERGVTCFTMLNRFPYSSGHLMVSPYRHVGELQALDTAELTELMPMAQRAVDALRAVMSPDGFNLGLNIGTAAGAGFKDHLHLHVVPRWNGDTNFMPVLAGTNVVPEALGATWRSLVAAVAAREEQAGPGVTRP